MQKNWKNTVDWDAIRNLPPEKQTADEISAILHQQLREQMFYQYPNQECYLSPVAATESNPAGWALEFAYKDLDGFEQPSGYEFLSFPDDLQQMCNQLDTSELQVAPSIPTEQTNLEQEYNDVIAKMEQLNPHGKEEISEYQKLASQRKELEAKLNISAPVSVKENTTR